MRLVKCFNRILFTTLLRTRNRSRVMRSKLIWTRLEGEDFYRLRVLGIINGLLRRRGLRFHVDDYRLHKVGEPRR